MEKSSSTSRYIEDFTPLLVDPKQVDTPANEDDRRVNVVFSHETLALGKGLGRRANLRHGAECTLVRGYLERLLTSKGARHARALARLSLNCDQCSCCSKRVR